MHRAVDGFDVKSAHQDDFFIVVSISVVFAMIIVCVCFQCSSIRYCLNSSASFYVHILSNIVRVLCLIKFRFILAYWTINQDHNIFSVAGHFIYCITTQKLNNLRTFFPRRRYAFELT